MYTDSIFRQDLFAGRRAIVTGGGSGIGRCVAHELLALGAQVSIVGRTLSRLDKVRAEAGDAHERLHVYACDIRDADQVQRTVNEARAAMGGLDILVNNAGGQFPARLEDISLKGWQAVLETNLTGGFLMARACLDAGMRDHGGAVVNVVADFQGSMPFMGHSGAARAGMVSFTETAALEWAQYGIRVNAVAPGYIASSGMDQYPPQMIDVIREAVRGVPLGRMGSEEEVSAAIVYLLSPAAAFITGTVLRIDGGRPQMRAGVHVPSTPDTSRSEAVRAFRPFAMGSRPRILDETT